MRKALLVALVVSGSVGAVGCIGDIIESQPQGMTTSPDLAPPGGGGGGGGGGTDAGAGNDAAGGGGGGGGDTGAFAAIQQDIDTAHGSVKSCSDSTSCHGLGVKPALKAATASGFSLDDNYNAFKEEVDLATPANSKVLTKNLPGGSHVGGAAFTGTDDAVYKRWLAWITAGATK